MLDNIADLLLTVGLLAGVFGFPTKFILSHMVPGTAIGVLVGDLLFFVMAFRLARRTGRNDITAMPLGLDTPSTIGMVMFVVGPAFVAARAGLPEEQAAEHAWRIAICALFISGVFKIACAFCSNWIRRVVPRAGLLGSLTAIALVLISFLPLLEVMHQPVVGMVSLAIILTTLVAKVRLPGRFPGALAALIAASIVYYVMWTFGWLEHEPPGFDPADGLLPSGWLIALRFEWIGAFQDTVHYLPIIIPFALATVVGGIDCTESAAAAGDTYDTNTVIAVEGFATIVAGLCGGVIQSTPYIGHPAYKAMGGRAAYVLATALFVGSAGLLGYFGYLYVIIPKSAVFTILIFIGLEITAQSFRATPTRHYAALVMACIPAMAQLVAIFSNGLLDQLAKRGVTLDQLPPSMSEQFLTIRILSNGFIVTSLLWASATASIIDRRLKTAGLYFLTASVCCLFGVIHSPFEGGRLLLPWKLGELAEVIAGQTPYHLAAAYAAAAAVMFLWPGGSALQPIEETDE